MTRLKAYHLRWLLAAVLNGLLLALWLGLSAWFYFRSLDNAAAEIQKGLRYELGRLALQMQDELEGGQSGEAERLLTFLGAEPGIEAVALLDATGRIWMASHFAWKGRPVTAQLPDIDPQALERTWRQRRPQVVFDWRNLRIEAFYPVVWQAGGETRLRDERMAVLYLRRDLHPLQALILREAMASSLLLAVALLVAWAGLWWILERLLLDPLARIADTMRRFAHGDRQAHLEVEGRGELARLARAFNEVAATLRRNEEELLRLQALYDTLSEINQLIVRSSSETELLERLCQVLVARAGFALVWLGEADGERVKAIHAEADDPSLLAYLADLEIRLDPQHPSGRGPTATALRERKAVTVDDVQASTMTEHWKRRARCHGIAASAAIPIPRPRGEPLVLNVYARQAGFFTTEIRRLLDELAEDLAFALDHHENEARRQAVEAALRASEKRLQVTFDSIGDAVIVTDANGRIERMNTVAEQLTGWPFTEARERPMIEVFRIVSTRTGEPMADPVAKVLEEGKVIGLANDTSLIARDGRRLQIADSAAPIRDETGQISGVVLVFHDVSEQYAMRRLLEENEARYRRMFEKSRLPELLIDPETGQIVDANHSACRFYGYTHEEMKRMSIDQINTASPQETRHCRQRALTGVQETFFFSHRLASGEIREVEVHSSPMEIGGKTLLHSLILDVTRRRQMEYLTRILVEDLGMKVGEGFLQALVARLGEALHVEYVMVALLNAKEAETVAVWSADEGLMENFRYDLEGTPCARVREGETCIYHERVRYLFPDDAIAAELGVESYAGTPLFNSAGEVIGLLAVAGRRPLSRVTDYAMALKMFANRASAELQRQQAEREIEQLAFYDPLTGLPNRRLFLDRLSQELAAARRHRDWGGLLFLDLDNFKHLNDAWGHQLGDELLIQVAERLQRHLRAEDSVARLGGDEFVVLLPRLGAEESNAADHLRAVAEKIRLHVAAAFDLHGRYYHTSVSIGVTLFHGEESVEALLKQADTAMYRAKAAGRNAIRFYHPAMQQSVDARLEMEKALRQALEAGELVLHYQPQHCAAGRLAGAEALLRWPHPQRGFIPPNEFIPIAEESGLILSLGRWVLETACSQISRWYREGLLAGIDHVAVNISPRQFHQADFVAEVEAVLVATGAPPEKLMLELTEGIVIEDIAATIAKMQALREMGVRFSIDDFGTGYSSLLYLKRLPLDELKIDRSFVGDLETDANDRAIVETILSMARHLQLSVVAEGVETEAQRDFLRRHGCHFYQGWLYSRPLPVAEFSERLRRRRLSG